MKNYYDMSKVDFVVDNSEYEQIDVSNFSEKPGSRLEVGVRIRALVEFSVNGNKFTLEGDEAERFIGLLEECQQSKERGLVK